MKRTLLALSTFTSILLLLGASAQADDGKVVQAVALKTTAQLDGRTDKTNYIHYFTWLNLDQHGIAVANQSDCKAAKWMAGKIAKRGEKVIKLAKDGLAVVNVELDIKVKYVPLTFEYDGQSKVVGHSWQGIIKGSIKDHKGTLLKKVVIKHRWGANTTQDRRKIKSQYMSEITKWVLLDLLNLQEVQKLAKEAKKGGLLKQLASLKTQKKKSYDDDFEDFGEEKSEEKGKKEAEGSKKG